MHRYKNISGESGVVAYDIGRRSITVEFRSGERYLYTDESAGADNITEMQRLATLGSAFRRTSARSCASAMRKN